MVYLQLFLVYLKIGFFGFGGGYAILSLIEYEVVQHYGWISSSQFTDIIAISQMTPGPIVINSATYVGYEATGSVLGSILATVAISLPSFILMISAFKILQRYTKTNFVQGAFMGIRPIVVGLIGAAALSLMNENNIVDVWSIVIMIVSFIGGYFLKWHPILIIVCAGVLGYFIY